MRRVLQPCAGLLVEQFMGRGSPKELDVSCVERTPPLAFATVPPERAGPPRP